MQIAKQLPTRSDAVTFAQSKQTEEIHLEDVGGSPDRVEEYFSRVASEMVLFFFIQDYHCIMSMTLNFSQFLDTFKQVLRILTVRSLGSGNVPTLFFIFKEVEISEFSLGIASKASTEPGDFAHLGPSLAV